MKMNECKKFDACSAPICPLDTSWCDRSHLPGERVCLYLREYAKTATRAQLSTVVPEEQYQAVECCFNKLINRECGSGFSDIRHALRRTSGSPSKIFNVSAENLK